MDYKKPITFRPTDEDAEALELLAQKNPILKSTTVDLVRIALQDYVFNHGPESGRSKSARIERLEDSVGSIATEQMRQRVLLQRIAEKVGIDLE